MSWKIQAAHNPNPEGRWCLCKQEESSLWHQTKPVQHNGILITDTKRWTEDFISACLLQLPSSYCSFLLLLLQISSLVETLTTGLSLEFPLCIEPLSLHYFLQLCKRMCRSVRNAPPQCPTAHLAIPCDALGFGCIPAFVCCWGVNYKSKHLFLPAKHPPHTADCIKQSHRWDEHTSMLQV